MNERAMLQHPVMRCLRRALQAQGLHNSPLVAAVSGGRDSTAMVAALAMLQQRSEAGLVRILHVHHGQRAASDDEAAAVERLGERLQLPVEVVRLTCPPGIAPAALRDARYEALARAAHACSADAVCVAHHADDQLETIVLALTRGAGPRGLAGMADLRTLDAEVLLSRPLLQVTRDELTDFCTRLDLPFCDDPGNVDPDTLRGRLRQDVLPVLESMRPGAAARVAAMAPVQAAAATALQAVLPQPVDDAWDRAVLARLPHAIRVAAVHRAVCETVAVDDLSSATLADACDAIGDAREHLRTFELGGGATLAVAANTVTMSS